MNVPVVIGGMVVSPGDAVMCDELGVLVLSAEEAEEEARAAIARQERGLAAKVKAAS
jgi:regulator of RNase E activity RraA